MAVPQRWARFQSHETHAGFGILDGDRVTEYSGDMFAIVWSAKDGKLYGRASCHMKAGLTANVFAVQALQSMAFRPAADVLLESVIGEESGGVGTLTTIVKGFKADAAIITEPTCLRACPVQSGALTFRITVSGRAIHACMNGAPGN